ncbi:nucleoside phosphorylase [Mucilaginibacter myungsuensis]|uniref:Uridine phosphorylase n=1 Tax=Mucilaginibacter myungsuensis TaxID=649104 RepID=A0A929KYN6_9SPHI|nr:nucleoside phosphorylase [Mucilaginibacter myungsuensis]MBE9663597.1 nucleoside phosphorylase [Mucilaginibacter myungsuensis]MDN3599079.1 nucleoside phosphorylase [Mucilaginibacter myungsuensis]
MQQISDTDLILNTDGSIYHLNLLPEDIADTVITVGDPDRVGEVSKHFDTIELKKGKREFITHTGTMGGKRITVLSTGIGTDNIDIVLNELDALVNINFANRTVNEQLRSLNIIRIGTSGAVQANIEVDTLLVSEGAWGLDALMTYYQVELSDQEEVYKTALEHHFSNRYGNHSEDDPYYHFPLKVYFTYGDKGLLVKLADDLPKGFTVTAPGFYAPQGRQVRAKALMGDFLKNLSDFYYEGNITNLEMETAGIYGLSKALGHKAISFNVILANRVTNVFSERPAGIMEQYIADILARIAKGI